MNNPKIAVVGCGSWGKNLIKNINELGALYSVFDKDNTLLENINKNFKGVKIERDFKAIISDPQINAIMIATNSPTHYELAKDAIESGKDVYIEKPMTLKEEESRHLVELAARHGRILMVGHLLLYHNAVLRLKEIINSGELGELYYLKYERMNLGTIRTIENAFWSLACHDISVILFLLGKTPQKISCTGFDFLQDEIEDITFCNLYFNKKQQAFIHSSWFDPIKRRTLTVTGTKKMAVFNELEADTAIVIYDKVPVFDKAKNIWKIDDAGSRVINIEQIQPLLEECRHFVECVISRKKPRTSGENGLEVVKILEKGQESMKKGGAWINLRYKNFNVT